MANPNRSWARKAQRALEAEFKSPISYQFLVNTLTKNFNTIKEHATASTKPMNEAILDILRPLVEEWLRKPMTETITDERGAKLVQALQAMVGINEPIEVSREGWRKMSPEHRQKTMDAYRALKAGKELP